MDMINNFNKAMKYIDQNLENEVDFKKSFSNCRCIRVSF
ncbi:hypothetical protein C671_2984 [[Clostridium] bifermentans ATCC 19299]|nr:hypothetical protein C671_2984 [[Clostridium] bifermentans ATCC 19299] [Paraclostridium bifermentans ATCC 19299]